MSGIEALGAASAIFQTISFAHELYNLCYDFYNDNPVAVDKLRDYCDWVKRATVSVQQHIEQLKAPAPGSDEWDLINALRRTRETADKIAIEAAYVLEKRQAGSIMRAFRTHYRYVKKKDSILALKSELEDCNRVTELMLTNRNIKQSDAALFQRGRDFSDLSDQVKKQVQQLIEQQTKAANTAQQNHREINANLAGLSLNVTDSHTKTRDHMDQSLARHAQVESDGRAHQQLLESLEFPDMWQRQNQIADPDDASFTEPYFSSDLDSESADGASNNSSVSVDGASEEESLEVKKEMQKEVREAIGGLRKWIETGTTPFWISGHAGSGKSTLVKFLVNQERQHSAQHLQPKKEVLAHYFWRAGSEMQQSNKGSFCSLIHQLLQNDPQRSELLLGEDETISRKKQVSDWSISELRRIFTKLIAQTPTIFVIFIDGLDEITEDGDLFDLLETLKWQYKLPNCRFCISSRPEYIIHKHLSGYPTIHVQELTYLNMSSYVTRKLDEAIATRGWDEADVRKLLSTLLWKAEGIFLWLVLVTDNLRKSIWLGKEYHDVLRRVDVLPTKLEALFTDMWERMGDDFASDQKLAASYINAVILHGSMGFSCTLLNVLFMVNPEAAGEQFGEEDKVKMADQVDWLEARRDEMLSHCLGLLVCRPQCLEDESPYENEEEPRLKALLKDVVFVHRSAYDFFTNTEPGQMILSKSDIPERDSYLLPAKALIFEGRILYNAYGAAELEGSHGIPNQGLIAATGLSEAVSFDDGIFAQAQDLLHRIVEHFYRWFENIAATYTAAVIDGIGHMFEMLAAPSIASTEIGGYILSDYFTRLDMPWRKLVPPQVLVSKMLEAGANPHLTMGNETYKRQGCRGAFNTFLLNFWLRLADGWGYQHGAEISRLNLNGRLAVLNSFLGANPNVNLASRQLLCLDGGRSIHHRAKHSLCQYSLGKEIFWRTERDDDTYSSDHQDCEYRHLLAFFSVDNAWLCRQSLASCRMSEPLGLFEEEDLSYLQVIEEKLDWLEERQCYQDNGLELACISQYVEAEGALFVRSQFNASSRASAAKFLSKQFERRIGESKRTANTEILWAFHSLMWVDDFYSYLVEDGETTMGELPSQKMYEWPQRSETVHRVDLESEGLSGLNFTLCHDGFRWEVVDSEEVEDSEEVVDSECDDPRLCAKCSVVFPKG